MNKETKLGMFAVIILAISIWGYNYLKGSNILVKSQVFTAEYTEMGELMVSSPVKINGFQVGIVEEIYLKNEDMSTIVAVLNIDNNIKLPKTTIAVIEPAGLMGGSAISLIFDQPCQGEDCAKSGDLLQGRTDNLITKMLGENNVDDYLDNMRSRLNVLLDTLNESSSNPDADDLVGQSLYDTRQSLQNTRLATEQLLILINQFNRQLNPILQNLNQVTGNLSTHNDEISGILKNTNTITAQVADADLGQTVEQSQEALAKIQTTIAELNKMTADLNVVISKVKNGEGTLGKLINDPEIYTNLQRTTRNVDLLLQDLRLNPKRYVHLSVFGKNNQPYDYPESDPAYSPEKK